MIMVRKLNLQLRTFTLIAHVNMLLFYFQQLEMPLPEIHILKWFNKWKFDSKQNAKVIEQILPLLISLTLNEF